MTRANWLIESDTFGEGLGRIRDEIRKQGMRVEIVSYIPAQSGMTYKDLYGPDECVVFYGSLEFAEQVRRQTTWVPGVYHTRDNFRCVSYYPQLAKYLLNSDYIMIPYGELMRQQSFLFSCLGEDDAVFIRPDVGYKIFTGQLIYRERFERDVQRLGFYEVKPSELCVVSRPRNLINEWRFVIADRKAIAGSRYRHNTAYDEDPGYPPEEIGRAHV